MYLRKVNIMLRELQSHKGFTSGAYDGKKFFVEILANPSSNQEKIAVYSSNRIRVLLNGCKKIK
jgi:hypothetical protein